MRLYGKNISKQELLKRVGDISQVGGISLNEMIDGPARGIRVADIKNGCGIDARVLIDRGMDISDFRFNSVPIAWKSSVRETSPAYYDKEGLEWLRTFYGGLLVTCGLSYAGAPSRDNGEELGLHGRIANISAANICVNNRWESNNYVLSLKGTVRESRIFFENLELTREIKVPMDEPKIYIHDSIENLSPRTLPLMIIYHMNFGFPLLDSSSYLFGAEKEPEPISEEAKKHVTDFKIFSEPVKDFSEHVFCHDIPADNEGYSNIALINEDFDAGRGIGIWLKYSKSSLPYLNQWKQTGFSEYVCGLEPANCRTYGRELVRQKGELEFIEPGQIKDFKVELAVLRSMDEINDLKSRL
ncbi:MAG: aldose 1-epimerase family protein [Actinobacteria bacterium]|nr:aldose 1-epimerase family protein [Actinomycetota bacterium]